MKLSRLTRRFTTLLILFYALGNAQVSVNEQTDRVEALKLELEQAKQMRDKVIAKRWEDKQKDTEARELFNRDYDEIKAKLELKNQEADRLHAEIQNLLRDSEEAEARAENEKVLFLSLGSILRDKIHEHSGVLEKSYPARIPERLQALNQVLKAAETRRDAPGEILSSLLHFERDELALGREIVLERRGFTRADKTPGEGLLLRIGTITSAYRDSKSGQVGLLLKNPPGASLTPFDWREDLPVTTSEGLSTALTTLDKGSGTTISIPMDVLLTQNAVKSYVHETKRSFFQSLEHAVKTGGVFMWPLLVIPFLAFGLFMRKLVQLMRNRGNAKQIAQIAAKLAQGERDAVLATEKKDPKSLVLQVLRSVAKLKPDISRDQAERAIRELLLHEIPRLERHLTSLSVLATAAPLLGLLGTVSGLISMFQVITEHGVNDPKLLAGGIGEALIATETGLLIAIPTLLGHNYLANRVDDLISDAQYHAMKALNALWPKD